MNTANLQMEGLLLAIAALCGELQRKNVLSEGEIEAALDHAEKGTSARVPELSEANVEAIHFPIRFLRLALQRDGQALDFKTIAAEIGRLRDRSLPP
jgi:hypothetical protein